MVFTYFSHAVYFIRNDDSGAFIQSSHISHQCPYHLLKTVLSLSLSPVLALFPNSPNSAQSLFLNTSLPSPCGCVPIYLPSSSVAQYASYSDLDICTFLTLSVGSAVESEGWDEDAAAGEEVEGEGLFFAKMRVSQNAFVHSSLYVSNRAISSG